MTAYKEEVGMRLKTFTIEILGGVDKLANIWGTKGSSIYGYFSGKVPGGELLAKLANKSSLNLKWLLTGNGEMVDINLPASKSGSVKIPVFGEVICGSPVELWDGNIHYIDMPDIPKSKSLFGLVARGDSMAPYINPRDILICSDNPSQIKNGRAVIAVFKGTIDYQECNAKLVQFDEKKKIITLYSVNTKYPPRSYSEDEIFKLYKVNYILREVK